MHDCIHLLLIKFCFVWKSFEKRSFPITCIQGFSLGHFLDKWPKDFENDLNFEDF